MGNRQFQFSVSGILWAILWISIGLATYPAFDAAHFLDDDPDNVSPRVLAAFWLVLATGVVGSFFGRPVKWAAIALAVWIPVCLLILLLAILPGLL